MQHLCEINSTDIDDEIALVEGSSSIMLRNKMYNIADLENKFLYLEINYRLGLTKMITH